MGGQKQFIHEDVIDKVINDYLAKGYEATAVRDLVAATKVHPDCLIFNTAVELGGSDTRPDELLAVYYSKMEDRLTILIERVQALGEFKSLRPARQLVRLMLSTIQGMHLLSKVNKTPAMLRDTAEIALGALDGDYVQ